MLGTRPIQDPPLADAEASSSELSAVDLIVPTMGALARAATAAATRICSEQPDDEAVHDFRVALRRMRSIARAARPLYGKRRCRRWEAALKRFGDATNALRDAEVLEGTITAAEFAGEGAIVAATWVRRQRRQRAALLRTAAALLDEGGHHSALDRVLKGMTIPRKPMSLRGFEARASATALADVAALLPVPPGDVERLHRLRIRFKRLRYSAEMLRGNWSPPALRDAATQTLGEERLRALARATRRSTKLQKRLGLLHDADQALAMLAADKELSEPHKRLLRQGLTRLRTVLVRRALRSLDANWSTPESR